MTRNLRVASLNESPAGPPHPLSNARRRRRCSAGLRGVTSSRAGVDADMSRRIPVQNPSMWLWLAIPLGGYASTAAIPATQSDEVSQVHVRYSPRHSGRRRPSARYPSVPRSAGRPSDPLTLRSPDSSAVVLLTAAQMRSCHCRTTPAVFSVPTATHRTGQSSSLRHLHTRALEVDASSSALDRRGG
jgi:hypothetical protein